MTQQIVIDIPASVATIATAFPSTDTLKDVGIVLGFGFSILAIIGIVLAFCGAIASGLNNAREKRETAAKLAKLSREIRDEMNQRGLDKFQHGDLPTFAKLDPLTLASLLDDKLIYWGHSKPSGPAKYVRSCYKTYPPNWFGNGSPLTP
jgi:hypothetical protein